MAYNKFTDEELAKRAYEWINESRDMDSTWRDWARKDFSYFLGNQWSHEDLAKMQVDKRPALTINQIRVLVKLVSGYQRQNRFPIRVYGVEESDEGIAGTLEELIQNIVAGQLYMYQDAQRFLHSIVTGRGYLFGRMDYSEDWLGELKLHARLNPLRVYYDQMSKDITLNDAEYVIWQEALRESAIRDIIGDQKIATEQLAELGQVDWGEDYSPDDWPLMPVRGTTGQDRHYALVSSEKAGGKGKLYRVLNVFYRSWDNAYFIADRNTGQLKSVASQEEGKQLVGQFPEYLIMVQRQQRKIKSALVCGNQVFDHKEATTGHRVLPIIPVFAGYMLGHTFGLVRDLTDIQDFLNKRFSNFAEILQKSSNSGWIGDEDAVKDWAAFEKMASRSGIVIKKRKGRELNRLDPTTIPTAEAKALSDGTELVKMVSGINPDLIGQSDKDTSGRAIMLRQQQGMQILTESMDNHRLATVQTAMLMIDAIQNNYTYEKSFRILMPDNQAKYLTINQRVYDVTEDIEKILNDVTVGKFDVVVGDQAISPTMRYLHFQELIEIVRETGLGVPPEVLVKASNLPLDMKREILEGIQAAAQATAQAAAGVPPTPGGGPKPGEVPFPEV